MNKLRARRAESVERLEAVARKAACRRIRIAVHRDYKAGDESSVISAHRVGTAKVLTWARQAARYLGIGIGMTRTYYDGNDVPHVRIVWE